MNLWLSLIVGALHFCDLATYVGLIGFTCIASHCEELSGWIQDFLSEGAKFSSGSLKQGVLGTLPLEAIGLLKYQN